VAGGGGKNGAAAAAAMGGVVVALVTNNADPDGMGRVKLKFPWLSDSYESDWARMTQAAAGPDSGACFLPEVNDEVLVAFEFGDVGKPVVVGGLHNGKDKPRLGDGLFDNGQVKRRGLVSRRGHRVVLFDDAGKSGIALLSSDGNLRVSLNETKNEIHLYCQGKIVLEAQGDLTLSSQQNVTVQAQSQLKLEGQAGASLTSSAQVQVQGALVKIN
jgi:uncharacterized protein involved in type VI secretion and phage assembly